MGCVGRRLVVLNGVLLAATLAAILAVQALDRPAVQVEAAVRRYAAAISAANLDAATAEIAPSERTRWRDWIAGQLGNIYDVRGIAVRSASLLSRQNPRPTEVTVVLDVNRSYPADFYQPTTRVPLIEADGGWYLAAPLLAPEAASASATASSTLFGAGPTTLFNTMEKMSGSPAAVVT